MVSLNMAMTRLTSSQSPVVAVGKDSTVVMGLIRGRMQALQLFFLFFILTLGYVLERGRGKGQRETDRQTETLM